MIYILSNLRTDKISEKYFTEKPYSLNCDKDSDIAIATGPMKEALANVMYHDLDIVCSFSYVSSYT